MCRGQFTDSATGLLQMPTAEMNHPGTLMITNNLLNKHMLAANRWGYHTFAYGFNITCWSRIELGYVCTILDGRRRPNPGAVDLILMNQDRHFYGKVLVFKEGEFEQDWMPAVAIGVSDSITGGLFVGSEGSSGNAFFSRYYVAITKHFKTSYGAIGVHAGYQYNKRPDIHYNAPCFAVDWSPLWMQVDNMFSTKLIAEFDARTFNIGFIASIWEDRFEAMFELMAMKWVNFGVRYKLVLKK